MVAHSAKPLVGPFTRDGWEAFLTDDPPVDGVRVLLRKKASTAPGIGYPEALDIALCFGWIDGQITRHDDDYTAQSFTPRRVRSVWSQVNREHIERLIVEGRMTPAGLAEVDRAKADGRWDAAYRQRDAPVPDDFRAALDASPAAAAFFDGLTGSARFAFLFRLGQAARPETRVARIERYIAMLERGERLG